MTRDGLHALQLLAVATLLGGASCSPNSPGATPASPTAPATAPADAAAIPATPRSTASSASPTSPPAASGTAAFLPAWARELPMAPVDHGTRAPAAVAFTDVAVEGGVRFRHQRGIFDEKLSNIMPWISSIGAAAAVSDIDGDGDEDLYVTTSRQGAPNGLFENLGGLRFRDIASQAQVADLNGPDGVSMDAAFSDLDNDGDDELYVVEWGRNRLFRNDGGRFTDITETSGTGDRGNGNCVLPFDYDSDGKIDLLVCNYFPNVDLDHLDTTRIMHDSFEAARNGGANVLYHNLGDLRFEEVSHSLHVDDTGWSLDAGIADVDNDGDIDVYIANDFGQDKLFLSNGDGTFTDATLRALGREGCKGMSIDFGDFNGDGFMDGYVANITTAEYLKEGNMLWLNAGDGTFSNVSGATGTFDGGWGWAARFFDFDNDGALDILAVNGFVTDGPDNYWDDLAGAAVDPAFDPAEARQWPVMGRKSLSGAEPARLWRNRGDGAFEEVAQRYGIADRRDGRGIALADFDQDGDLDVYLANQDALGALYRNDVGGAHRFLLVSLVGSRSNKNGVGARIEVVARVDPAAPSRPLIREVNSGNAFSSQSSYTVHFGLGQADRVERLTVFWPSGVVEELRDLPVDRHLEITEEGVPLPPATRAASYFGRRPSRGAEETVADGAAPKESAVPALLELEEALRRKPCNVPLAGRYRALCADARQFDRAIHFFEALIKGHSEHIMVRLHLALSLVDKIPFLEGDVLAQGSVAKEALYELQWIEERCPDLFALHYIAGMNHLYWPESLKHFDDAVAHLQRCIAILDARERRGGAPGPHCAEVYRALGDAHVKGKRFDAAREAWRRGLERFPGADFGQRLGMPEPALVELVKVERGLTRRIDTRLEWLAEESGLDERERQLEAKPDDRVLLGDYRLLAEECDDLERAERFLQRLVSQSPTTPEPHLHLALARLQLRSAGSLSAERDSALLGGALEELERCRSAVPADPLATYFLGVAHLAWTLEGGPAAAVPLLQEASSRVAGPGAIGAVPEVELALGDALTLSGRQTEGVEVWRRAAQRFPRNAQLALRLESPLSALAEVIRAERGAGRGISTDLERLRDHESERRHLEEALRAAPRRATLAEYRRLVLLGDDPEAAIRLLEALIEVHPRSADLRVELALAYLDRIPAPDLGSVRKGLLASEALRRLHEVLAAFPDSSGLHVIEGLIHLHWFTKQGHLPAAISALERSLALEEARSTPSSWKSLVYQALGDALVKQGSFPGGRRVWRQGLDQFPSDRGLSERLGLTGLMVERYLEERRSWSAPLDTQLLSRWVGDLANLPSQGAE